MRVYSGLCFTLAWIATAGCERRQPVTVAQPAPVTPTSSVAEVASTAPPRPPPRGRIVPIDKFPSLIAQAKGSAEGGADAGAEGRLAPEVIKRVIRATFPKFRACYEQALKSYGSGPMPHGTVVSQYIIGLEGWIETVASKGTDPSIPQSMVDCISLEYLYVEFPRPEGGKVWVTYPIDFQNDDQ